MKIFFLFCESTLKGKESRIIVVEDRGQAIKKQDKLIPIEIYGNV